MQGQGLRSRDAKGEVTSVMLDSLGHRTDGEWAFATRPYRALGYDFRVRGDDVALGRYLDQLFEAFPEPTADRAVAIYSLVDGGATERFRYQTFLDGIHVQSSPNPADQLAHVLWRVNQGVISNSGDYILIHASAAESAGVGLLFPAPMESGKTTLVAGLLRSGFRYLTDEAVAIDIGTGLVEPFPRALSVDEGSWLALADVEPQVPDEVRQYLDRQWQLPPNGVRNGSVAPPSRPGLVIAPKYVAGARTSLVRMKRSEALVTLAENAFNFRTHGRRGLATLADVVASADCYRLEIGDLTAACDLIIEAVEALKKESRL